MIYDMHFIRIHEERAKKEILWGYFIQIISCLMDRSTLNLSNGETESVKTMIVHDDVESEPAMTPSKEGTLIVRQVLYFLPCTVLCLYCDH